ncbi:MAG: Uncharacterised protein [Rhodospirillaceae bacterium]|nr:MAG: Uncharacterised protein [Rhodospirillaceae bacterium]
MDKRNIVMITEQRYYFISLALAQQPSIHKYACQLVAYCLMDKNRSYRAIHPARQTANHIAVTDLLAQISNCLSFISGHRPIRLNLANLQGKIVQQPCPAIGMHHFWMELHPIIAAPLISNNRIGRASRRSDNCKSIRQSGNMITVAHPNRLARARRPYPLKERASCLNFNLSMAKFAAKTSFNHAA